LSSTEDIGHLGSTEDAGYSGMPCVVIIYKVEAVRRIRSVNGVM